MLNDVKFENFEREILDTIYDEVVPYSQMEKNEKYFLNGVVRYLKPKKILEVGVAHGGGSAIILNAIKDLSDSNLFSVDYCEKVYGSDIRYTNKLSGYVIDEKFPSLKDKWKIFRGGDISKFIENIGGDIDLLVLDTAHIHPWETLNFICVLPFMKKNSWVILHDISLPLIKDREEDLACRYLYGHVVSDEKIMPVSDIDSYFANIGAFKVMDDTKKYVGNLFESLLISWQAMPEIFNEYDFPLATPMLEEDISNIKKIIEKYYPEYSNFFEHIIEAQRTILKHKVEKYKSLLGIIERNFPYVITLAGKLKKLIKKTYFYKKFRRF